MLGSSLFVSMGIGALITVGILAMVVSWYKKAKQGEAIVKTGIGGTKVSFNGIIVIPVIHRYELMDITVKKIITARQDADGLICKDNMRADIKVTFFVRVNKTKEDVVTVAQSIGASRASDPKMLESLFDAKFSEALKTVGKRFDFVELYNARDEFKKEILQVIGTDLNGYALDDCAIDYLEQTSITALDERNILDAEGIKKIIQLTSNEKVKANLIQRDKEMTIKKQDVEARETILELEKQQKEKEESQRREIETIKAREQAEIDEVRETERQKAQLARISAEEEINVKEQNKQRQVEIARLAKEKAKGVEEERVQKERDLEATEREKIVTLAQIAKEKAVEEEKRDIQEVIRERVSVEKAVVEEQEKIKDTEAFAQAERVKSVALTAAEQEAQENLVKEIKAAEASKAAAEHIAKQKLIDAQADQESATMKAEALKTMADAHAAEVAAKGMGEAQVIEATAAAMIKKGESDAKIIELEAFAQAKGEKEKGVANAEVIEVKASAIEKQGMAEARVSKEKYVAEAEGIAEKAAAMQKLDGVGKEHEEFKLRLDKDLQVELAQITIQKDIADAQAQVIAEALKQANIDIVGGDGQFFDKITNSITKGKSVDRMVNNSDSLKLIQDTFFDNKNGLSFKDNMKAFIDQFGMSAEQIKDLSIANVLNQMANKSTSQDDQNSIGALLQMANVLGITNKAVGEMNLF